MSFFSRGRNSWSENACTQWNDIITPIPSFALVIETLPAEFKFKKIVLLEIRPSEKNGKTKKLKVRKNKVVRAKMSGDPENRGTGNLTGQPNHITVALPDTTYFSSAVL